MSLSTPEQTLVRLLRGGSPWRDDPIADLNTRDVDWMLVEGCARRQGLEPLLYRALQAQNLLGELPGDLGDHLRRAFLHTTANNLLLHSELARLLECFRHEQIQVILLKGCALVESLYPDMGVRPMADLDMLIQPSQVARVSNLVQEQGYLPNLELSNGFQRSFKNEQTFVRSLQPSVILDVHWHLLGESYYFNRVPIDWFWERTVELRVDDQPARMFTPAAQLLHLASHYVIHHKGEGLRWSYDLALLLSRYREQFEWRELLQAAQRFGLTPTLRSALNDVSEIWGIGAPADALSLLSRSEPSLSEHLSLASHTARHVDALSLWNGLSMPSPRGKLAYLRYILWPSRSYMQTRYGIADARLLLFYRFGRLAKGLGMFVRSVGSIALNSARVFRRARMSRSPDAR